MKANYTTISGRITFEIDGDSPKALFRKLSLVQEIFDADASCGDCGATDLVFRTRKYDGNEFFELGCRGCHARLSFGQNKEGGGLFPKRKDKDGAWLPNGGWSKYAAASSDQSAPETAPARPRISNEISDNDIPF